ncbi:hypothetical protein [Desulfobulbus alkaliphilus]|nr:hypothetical protein [Desulfobulbus alkaliphilus]
MLDLWIGQPKYSADRQQQRLLMLKLGERAEGKDAPPARCFFDIS